MPRCLVVVVVVVVAAGVSSGCYFRRTMHDESLPPNTSVTVTLSYESTDALSDLLGPGARALDGRVLPSARDTVALAVRRMTRANGRIEQWKGEHVALPRRAVTRVEHRWFSPLATAALVGGAFTGLVLAANVAGRPPVRH